MVEFTVVAAVYLFACVVTHFFVAPSMATLLGMYAGGFVVGMLTAVGWLRVTDAEGASGAVPVAAGALCVFATARLAYLVL